MKITAREMNRIAGVIDRVVGELDVRAAAAEQRHLVRDEAARVIEQLADGRTKAAERLRTSLERLIQLMDAPDPVETAGKPRSARSWQTLMKAFAALLGGMAFALPAAAAPTVGETFTHPFYPGKTLTWEVIEDEGYVAVDQDGMNYSFLALPAVGSQLAYDYVGGQWQTATVVGYQTASGAFTTSIAQGADGLFYDVATSELITHAATGTVDLGVPTVERTVSLTSASGGGFQEEYQDPVRSSANQIQFIRKGSKGKNGNNAVFLIPAASGGAGGNGPTVDQDFSVGTDIDVVANRSPAVHVASIGGNGGDGGDAYGSIVGGGKKGGRGGSGGRVETNISGSGVITTNGTASHGVVVQSAAGVGGEGGSNFASVGGTGAGGIAANGGDVDATVDVEIRTIGNESHGVLIQSLGGGAGKGGSSYGLFGYATNGGWGGNGGNIVASVDNNIRTEGNSSHGVVVQSIGGQGGDGGGAGGIVAFGGDGGIGGNGGTVDLTLKGNVTTIGTGSYGVVVQSIGGSGGNGGAAGGLVALGSKGSEGGAGNTVDFTMEAGSSISTDGIGSFGAVVQSIGGGGGNAGASGGLVSVGGRGGSGSHGGAVTSDLAGDITTKQAGSVGLVAQSIGGGGGTGRASGGLVAIGSDGGKGGNAGSVEIVGQQGHSINTHGVASAGILAQSIGGGGGNAGVTGGMVAIGAKGGDGGSAGTVDVTSDGLIYTRGKGSDGIVAQSIGGGGGMGGGAYGFVALGGSGASGGSGSAVTVDNGNYIRTEGERARGIVAQSIGGGGGIAGIGGGVFSEGGNAGAGGSSNGQQRDTANIGGSAGTISHGAAVSVINSGRIETLGNLGTAIMAQSIGGGGGDGANAVGLLVGLGGTGGAGGNGGKVTIDHTGSISTRGHDAAGIFAQSIGGGGGNGGWSAAIGIMAGVAIGGSGGDGGNGGEVELNFGVEPADASSIVTHGDRATGVIAQSIGGGGGNGGYSVSETVSVLAGVSLSLGGKGATGGEGGLVRGSGYTHIETHGDFADGMLLQSIGGGGGNGGFALALGQSVGVASISLATGGSGAGGGHAGDVEFRNGGGSIVTEGAFARGLVAQSIGGGGGNGALTIANNTMVGIGIGATVALGGSAGAGGDGGLVDIDYSGDVGTEGLGATAVLWQSIGGGGGAGGASIGAGVSAVGTVDLTVSLGGSGGDGGLGGTVQGTLTGDVVTLGDLASGVVAQSIGGGGGNAGYSVAGSMSGGLGGVGIAVGIGGTGGDGGDGGTVDVTVDGTIGTAGDLSTAFLAQSVGGGGGNGGYNVSGALAGGLGAVSVSVGLGGNGGEGGHGGSVTATVTDQIITEGEFSQGFVAQSVGGGGGNGAFNVAGGIAGGISGGAVSVGLGGFGAQAGDGGNVIANAASIQTAGTGSTGFLAQSIGGAGGSGGFNVTGGIAGGVGAATVNVGIGGFGAGGGDAGTVEGTVEGDVYTKGDLASGLVAQSIGGGGGSGGWNVAGGIAAGEGAGAINVGIGGYGAEGSDGARASLTLLGDVVTEGLNARGLVVQSIGGGGGDGGFNVTGGAIGAMAGGTVNVGLGGNGGGGGDAGEAVADITGDVGTKGNLSTGVLVQSIGGGGGAGGFNVAAGIAGGTAAGAISVGLGGDGGAGGDASTVDFTMIGNAITEGLLSHAVVLQSLGGGGGDGGFNVAAGVTAGLNSGNINVGLGGSGGGGGRADTVRGELTGLLQTAGDLSAALIAQSLGGGGGSGGFNVSGGIAGGAGGAGTLNFGLGGSGGGGGDGALVDLTLTGTVDLNGITTLALTTGDQALGIVAQSIGGGGGTGSFNVAGGVAGGGGASGTVNVGLGGSGGDGGDGGEVIVATDGSILTSGFGSSGLIAQSVGGGGGSGSFNVTGGIVATGAGGGTLGFGMGGSGGGGGDAGNVQVTHQAGANADGLEIAVLTEGDMATGLLAQSIGGGGGAGGFNVTGGLSATGAAGGTLSVGVGGMAGGGGAAGNVDLNTTGFIQTAGDFSRGAVAQSIGGGGGEGGMNVSGAMTASAAGAAAVGVGIGGFGGDGGQAGNVTLTAIGASNADGDYFAALTKGDNAAAFTAQSIGGGGGTGGMNVTGGMTVAMSGAGNLGFGLGGFGGKGGQAGTVQADVTGQIVTQGRDATAILAQSLGGGGGSGGMNVTGGITLSNTTGGNIGLGVGGFGGEGGDAANVGGIVNADIMTKGDNALGLAYQSIGGGGGSGGMNITGGLSAAVNTAGSLSLGLGGFGGDGGSAGEVDVTHVGNVSTEGDFSTGLLAQSLGGGGGSGGMSISGTVALSNGSTSAAIGLGLGGFGGGGGNASSVTANVTGTYLTKGDGAAGVVAQSLGGGGGSGGMNITGALSFAQTNSVAVGIGLGGFGGGGGDASRIDFVRNGDTQTEGLNADGILLQSIGGSGGAGAINITGGISLTNTGAATTASLGVGGFGGDGGHAGRIDGIITGNVWARGASDDVYETVTRDDGTTYRIRRIDGGSNGVLAQSVGGGGGNGGINVSGAVAFGPPQQANARVASIGLGGFGGGGGDGEAIDLTIASTTADRLQIQGHGDYRSAVAAQSIGGGGGAGGFNFSGGISLDGQAVLGVGGFGGDGGESSRVDLVVDADLFAQGTLARGLLAQSIGGGGGAGGLNVSGGFQADQYTSEPTVVFGIGGFGGAGGRSYAVDVDQIGNILVDGVDAVGALVQSIAGGGGSGGLNVSLAGSIGDKNSFLFSGGVGGTGGAGDDSGDVRFDSLGTILVNTTASRNAEGVVEFAGTEFTGGGAGVLVQSIGGGGGTGGINVTGAVSRAGSPIALGVGGTGGSGGDAGAVTVNRGFDVDGTAKGGLIYTHGDGTTGLMAQSIGGGGGNAGYNLVLGVKPTGSGTGGSEVGMLVNIGGSGAGAGSADRVDVRHNGTIVTQGHLADGIVAQSIGGGGGNGTFNLALGVFKDARAAMTMTIGGATGAAGRAEAVNVHHRGDIFTSGELSRGIVAQSIGGGGGNAGTDVGLGILAKAGLTMALGRVGGTGGEGGTVDVDVDGRIVTQGELSDGILAQSIGGGGGTSGAISVSGSFKTAEEESMGGSISIGLEGGQGAVSDDVSVRFAGELYTSGDDARGIFAQTIGGGGGVGGGASATQFMTTGSANMAIGGTGGQGAVSGDIDIDNLGLIRTSGDGSDGILAQAIGGGGGLGGSTRVIGFQVAASKGSTQNTAVFAIGGSGGVGADGGQIDINNTGKVITEGLNANGIRAQSIGGGGGIGGAVYAARVQGPGDNNSVEMLIGGAGGTGGSGALVNVENTGLIYTTGDNAAGIAAASIGGGGGDAGTVLSLTLDGAVGSRSNRLVTTIGGAGGAGGLGGAVVVSNLAVDGEDNTGTIVTEGLGSHGIVAQSIGGGGGNGSSVVNVQAGLGGSDSVVGGLAIGGTGGTGNLAGTVDVENTGLIYTSGDSANGILAQSIGGGGGNGGLSIVGNLLVNPSPNAPVASLGGFGGDGGNGNRVTVDNSGSILTTGANAHGIVAQSIGGGGGNANLGLSAGTEPFSAIASNALSFALGNVGGGNGGIGGEVVVNHSGDITVTGDGSVAIKAESINGGGGTLALDIYGLIGLPGMPYVDKVGISVPAQPAIVARLGAEGSTSMNAGKVTVNTTGTINAGGDRAVVDFAQAIGGGGGTLNLNLELADYSDVADAQATGFNVMLGGLGGVENAAADIESQHQGAIVAAGDLATGILAQAIGGGGGRGVLNIAARENAGIARGAVTLGATDTRDETGGAIDRNQTGAVLTGGDYSTASVLQSIGGGGGSVVAQLDGTNDGVDLRLGAQGGSGADARNVSGHYAGGVQTFGAYASGLVLQSIGAGGGEIRVAGAADAPVLLGGSGGVSGDAGDVSLNHQGIILTEGTGAHGLVLQSIGGGGGAVFGNINGPVSLSSANTGNGGDISLTQDQLIVARGANAYGVIAQSLGGGGGWVDGQFAGSAGGQGASGDISLSFAQGVYAVGDNGVAIFAQSEGRNGSGDISLALNGAVRGGDGEGAGVRLSGGVDNRITTNVMLSSVSGWAIQGGTGNDRVINTGQVFGNLDLGAGDNRFVNRAGASFTAFDTIKLRDGETTLTAQSITPMVQVIEGAEATFTNEGVFRMGLEASAWPIDLGAGETFGNWDDLAAKEDNIYYGARAITTVELDGNFVQTATGTSVFDVAFGNYASDRVNVTGDARIEGDIAINLMWLEDAKAVTLFATEGTGWVGDVQIDGTLALNFSLKGDDAGVHLMVESDFGQSFLRPNEERLGGHLDSALQTGGATGIGRLMAALGNMVAGQEELYQAIFTDLNPEGHVAAMQTQYYGATQFADRLFGCGLGRDTALDRCVWGVGSTTAFDQEETGEYWGVTSRIFNARVGMEQRLNADWALSLAAGYNSLQRQQTARMNTQGDGFDVGAGLIRQDAKGTDLRLTATGGWQWLESQRYGYVFDSMVGHSKGQNGYLQLGAELGHTVRAGDVFVRPALSVMGTALINGSYAERGWDGLGARVEGDTQYIGAIEPKITGGWTLDPAEGVNAALSMTAGRVHRSEDGISLPIRLMGASMASDAAAITTPLDRSAWKLGFEAKIQTDTGVTFHAGYDGQLGDKADVHTGSISVRWAF